MIDDIDFFRDDKIFERIDKEREIFLQNAYLVYSILYRCNKIGRGLKLSYVREILEKNYN